MGVSDCARVAAVPEIDVAHIDDHYRSAFVHGESCLRQAVDADDLTVDAGTLQRLCSLDPGKTAWQLDEDAVASQALLGTHGCQSFRLSYHGICKLVRSDQSGAAACVLHAQVC